MSKYGARKIKYNGEVFDSHMEMRRYCQLRMLEKAGRISDLKRQVKYELIPAQRDMNGKLLERPVSYIADFVYVDHDRRQVVVEDAKGARTKDYIIKRKLMRYIKGIAIEEVRA